MMPDEKTIELPGDFSIGNVHGERSAVFNDGNCFHYAPYPEPAAPAGGDENLPGWDDDSPENRVIAALIKVKERLRAELEGLSLDYGKLLGESNGYESALAKARSELESAKPVLDAIAAFPLEWIEEHRDLAIETEAGLNPRVAAFMKVFDAEIARRGRLTGPGPQQKESE